MRILCRKSPMVGRFFACVLLLFPLSVSAQEASLDVEEAVRRALSNPAIDAILEGEIREARAEAEMETVVAAPTLGVSHEQVVGDAGAEYLELSVGIEQEFDLSPWRGHVRRAGSHRQDAARSGTAAWRLELAAAVRLSFFEIVYRQERVAVFDHWIGNLQEGVVAVSTREEHGDVSELEVRRIERALESARAQQAMEGFMLGEAWAALHLWVPWDERPSVSGELTPTTNEHATGAVLPSLERLEHLRRAVVAEANAFGRPFWREWTVGAGYRFADVGSATGHGFLFSLSVPLTLWNTDRPREDRLAAERARIDGELSMQQTLAARAEQAAHARLTEALSALSHFPPEEHDAELTRLAETTYGAGEATLTELLEAYAGEVELQLGRIDLEWEARRSSIELARRRGNGVLQ